MTSPRVTCRLGVAGLLLWSLVANADQDRTLPPQLAFVTGVIQLMDPAYGYPGYTYLDWVEYDFNGTATLRGKNWHLRGTTAGNLTTDQQRALVTKAFLAAGWTIVKEGQSDILKIVSHGVVSDARVSYFDNNVIIDAIEVAPNPLHITLRPPAAKPEKMAVDKGDFPYLTPPPGADFKNGGEDRDPFWVQLPGESSKELVATRRLVRNYVRPPALSNLEFVDAYQGALVKAGWDIISIFNSADASIVAHYTKHERNLWLYTHAGGQDLTFTVADGNADDLKARLAQDCHVALVGLLFDFNKATLKPASDPVLQKALALLKKSPSLKVEIQGHTDNVGDDAYNQKLSEERAGTVVKWLTKHGVVSKRLSSHGYGKTQPVADNGSDEGRAKNRRVEISDPTCKPRS